MMNVKGLIVMTAYVIIQLALPLRAYVYSEHPCWTNEGKNPFCDCRPVGCFDAQSFNYMLRSIFFLENDVM